MSGLLIAQAELGAGAPCDVRIRNGRISELRVGLDPAPGEIRLDARGGALLPGLHDHHIHLMSLAAALDSLPCGPPAVCSRPQLVETLRAAGSEIGWLRGVGYHESVAGELDRWQLDAWLAHRPLRIQHRSGALWMLNSAAVESLRLEHGERPAGVERDSRGRVTGRLFGLDDWLGRQLPPARAPRLAPVGERLARLGLTALTDATAGNTAAELERLTAAVERAELPQRLLVMGVPTLPPSTHVRVTRGHVKYVLAEDQLPDIDELAASIRSAHDAGRDVAIHCVTLAELVLAASALGAGGCRLGDRIEHASVTPPDVMDMLAPLPVTVVTQPNFIFERGDAYRVDVESRDRPWLYRCRGFLAAGLRLGAGTDAPFGDPDPWAAMRAAVERRSVSGRVLGVEETLTPEQALALFTSPARAPGTPPPPLRPGAVADLCLLDRPWLAARDRLDAEAVVATIRDGEIISRRE